MARAGQFDASEADPDAGTESALAALRKDWDGTYDVGAVTIRDELGTILYWVAVRLEGEKPEPLTGLTPEALDAAIRDDRAWAGSR